MSNGTVVVTGVGLDCVRAASVAMGLEFHVKSGGQMRLTRMASPKALMQMATEITGQKFKARDYAGAAKALREWVTKIRTAAVQQPSPTVN